MLLLPTFKIFSIMCALCRPSSGHTDSDVSSSDGEGSGLDSGAAGGKKKGGKKGSGGGSSGGATEFVHTLNATACAVPRMIVAILENYQQEVGASDTSVFLINVLDLQAVRVMRCLGLLRLVAGGCVHCTPALVWLNLSMLALLQCCC